MYEDSGLDVDALSPGASVLFVSADRPTGTDVLFGSLGSAGEDAAVLIVTTGDAHDAIARLQTEGVRPDAIGVVDASGAGATPDGVAEAQAVDGTGELSRLGIAISDVLDRLGHNYHRVLVGLDTTTDLAEAASVPATFRFLHVLAGRVRNERAALLATLDRSAHDEEDRRTVAQLFDEPVTVE